MNIEVKFQSDKLKDRQDQFNHLVNHSAQQGNDHDEYLSNVHASIFGPGWRMIKVSAVIPGTSVDLSSLCPICRKCLITDDILKSKDSFQKWWNRLGLTKINKNEPTSLMDPHYQEYLAFFKRIVGFMHVRKDISGSYQWEVIKNIGLSPWKKIMGETYKSPISTGLIDFTELDPSSSGKGKRSKCTKLPSSGASETGKQRFRDYKTRAMDVDKYLYLTAEQRNILSDKSIQKAILMSDFGGGKTYLYICR